jgi:hypothetical protein
MLRLVNCRVHANCCRRARESFIKAPLLHIGAEAVDSLETGGGIDR